MDKMTLSLSKVAHIDDFSDADFESIFKKYNLSGIATFPQAEPSILNRKTWEIGMALISFEKLGIMSDKLDVLGIGAAKEETISILSNIVKRVFATDIYLEPGTWGEWYERDILVDARKYMGPVYNHKRVVWQHVDGRDLPYEDNSMDAVFSCSSLEHFGSEADIRKAVEEACRVLKPGGVAAISSEYKIEGHGDGFANVQLFDEERLKKVWFDGIPWTLQGKLDLKLDDTVYIDFEKSIHDNEYKKTAHPHIKLDNGMYKWTSIHMTFIKD